MTLIKSAPGVPEGPNPSSLNLCREIVRQYRISYVVTIAERRNFEMLVGELDGCYLARIMLVIASFLTALFHSLKVALR